MDENEKKDPINEGGQQSFDEKQNEASDSANQSGSVDENTEKADEYKVDDKYKKETPFSNTEGSFDSRRDYFDRYNQNRNNGWNNGYNQGQDRGYNSGNGYYNGNNSGYNRYDGYYPPSQPNQPKKKSQGSLLAVCALIALFVFVAFIAFGFIYTEYLTDDEGVNNGGQTEQTPGGTTGGDGSITQGDFNIPQTETPGASYPSFADAYAATHKTFVEIYTLTESSGSVSAGSGVIISRKSDNSGYYIVTNNHVVEGATKITVRAYCGNDYKEYTANSTVLRDEMTDLAVLFISETAELQVAKVGKSSNLRVGENVYVIGNPLGTLAGTMTNGIISAQAVEIFVGEHYMELIQTNTAINPGNSGGPMFNMSGELVGIVNAKYSDVAVEGIGFAIPIDIAKGIVEQMITKGYVEGRHNLGLSVEYGFYYSRPGLWITGVENDSVLNNTDLNYSNANAYRVESINGYTFESTASANIYIDSLKAGDTVKMKVTVYQISYGGTVSPTSKEITVTLGQKSAS